VPGVRPQAAKLKATAIIAVIRNILDLNICLSIFASRFEFPEDH
jgi:hypothetical protein